MGVWAVLENDTSLTQWWTRPLQQDEEDEEEEKKVTPVAFVEFLNIKISNESYIKEESTIVSDGLKDEVVQLLDVDQKVYLVFYAISHTSGKTMVLGCLPTHVYLHCLKRELKLGDLVRDRFFDYRPFVKNVGSGSADFWMYLPFSRKALDDTQSVDERRVQKRLDFAFDFWRNRHDRNFLSSSGKEGDAMTILRHLHDSRYFNLHSEDGRRAEYSDYWTTMFLCGHDDRLWEVWEHWEKMLFEFRLREYFCKEHHFSLLLRQNTALSGVKDILSLDQVDQREKQLYRLRWPTGPFPTIWVNVTIDSKLASHPLYDVEDGHVLITHRDFGMWAWNKMKVAAFTFMSRLNVYSHDRKDNFIPNRAHAGDIVRHLIESKVHRLCREVTVIDNQIRSKRERDAFPESGLIVVGVESGYEAFVKMAKQYFPPCQLQHVWILFEKKGRHPNYLSRTSIATFLVSLGYSKEAVERVVYMMYEADAEFMAGRQQSWNMAAFQRECGAELSFIYDKVVKYKTLGAFGCTKLIEAGQQDAAYGCPFTKSSAKTREMLVWAGLNDNPRQSLEVPDIEDIMTPRNFPQEQCMRYHARKHDIPLHKAPVIKHPLRFMRVENGLKTGGGAGQKRLKEEEILV